MPIRTRSEALTHLLPDLNRLARILSSNASEAEDLAQEALLKVWSKLESGAEIEELRPYLMTTLRNAAKRRPNMQMVELDEPNIPTEDGSAAQRLIFNDVLDAIARLPEDQAQLLRAVFVEGAGYSELATRFDLPQGTVMSRLARARQRLRRELDLPEGHAVDALIAASDP